MSWLNKLQNALADEADKIQPGWWCLNQEEKRLKKPLRTIKDKVSEAVRLGVLERKKFRVIINGRFRRVYYYKEVV
jgi:hypothetical protein